MKNVSVMVLLVMVVLWVELASGQVLYVKDNATGTNDGSSWTNAFTTLQSALSHARTVGFVGDIWVARAVNNNGRYLPDEIGKDRTVSFELLSSVRLLGGFAGTETSLTQRDINQPTTLSGDNHLDDYVPSGTRTNNAYHVVTAPPGTNTLARLDGFIITEGYADFTGGLKDVGGGMLIDNASPTVALCNFKSNSALTSGGAIHIRNGSQPHIYMCTFDSNGVAWTTGGAYNVTNGGAIFNHDSAPLFEWVIFISNGADYGGAIHSIGELATPEVVGCEFLGNSAYQNGGGVFSMNGNMRFINCIFSGNQAFNDGAGIHVLFGEVAAYQCTFSKNAAQTGLGGGVCVRDFGSASIYNSILWGNTDSTGGGGDAQIYLGSPTTGRYSLIYCLAEGILGTGPPNFVNDVGPDGVAGTKDDDLRLAAGSPCIDAGSNYYVPPDIIDANNNGNRTEPFPIDIEGLSRFMDDPATPNTGEGAPPIVDMGAHEYWSSACSGCWSRLYVDKTATGADDGSSWTNAFPTLSEALEEAANCCGMVKEIWVAEGTYIPAIPFTIIQRTNTFQLVDGCTVYGGFAGTEQYLHQRRPALYPTTLSGDMMGDDATANYADNVYHVVTGSGVKEKAVLDGFIITGGYADYAHNFHDMGGGLLCNAGSPIIRNCTFTENVAMANGGAVFCVNNSSPLFDDCTFSRNRAGRHGGAAFHNSSEPTYLGCVFENNYLSIGGYHGGAIHNANCGINLKFINCLFWSNHADQDGGAVFNNNSHPGFTNCIFTYNTSNQNGGAILNNSSNPAFINCTIYSNYAQNLTGGIHNIASSQPMLANTILWDNSHGYGTYIRSEDSQIYVSGTSASVDYCIVQGWTGALGGTGNSGQDPRLVLPYLKNFQLGCGSPAIDAGDNAALPTNVYIPGIGYTSQPFSVDIAGQPRRTDDPATPDTGSGTPPIVDIGAMEFQGLPSGCPSRLYVDINNVSALPPDGTSWATSHKYLSHALAHAAACCGQVTEVWVAKGTYYPDPYQVDRSMSFHLVDGVAVYGGFAGTETALNQRDVKANPTILSGDLNDDDFTAYIWTDNSYHVVIGSNVSRSAVLDGFTIKSGYADGTGGNRDMGAGMLNVAGSPTLRNCTFQYNMAPHTTGQGGGIANLNASAPMIRDCSFYKNVAGLSGVMFPADYGNGGAIFNMASDPVIINCQFERCGANAGSCIHNVNCTPALEIISCAFMGNFSNMGAIFNNDSSPTLINSVLAHSWSNKGGGGMYNLNGSNPTLINCTIMHNTSNDGSGGIYNLGGSNPELTNCILWNNAQFNYQAAQYEYTYSSNIGPATGGTPVVNYSCIQHYDGSQGGTGNTGWDPLLTNQLFSGTQFTLGALKSGSVCIDAGDNSVLPADKYDLNENGDTTEPIPLDVAGLTRKVDDPWTADTGIGSPPLVDMGAHEHVPGPSAPTPTATGVLPTSTPAPVWTLTPTHTPLVQPPTVTQTPTDPAPMPTDTITSTPGISTNTPTQPIIAPTETPTSGAPGATDTPTSIIVVPTDTPTDGPPACSTPPVVSDPEPPDGADPVPLDPLLFWNANHTTGEVLWDLTHGVLMGYGPANRYSDLAQLMMDMGFNLTTTTAGVETINLSLYKVLIISAGTAYNSAYTPAQADAIANFVMAGGQLIIMGDNPGMKPDHLNPVAQRFGITCGVSDLLPPDLVFNNFAPHPIFDGCSQLTYRQAGEMALTLPAEFVAWEPGGAGTVAVAHVDAGRVVALGDMNCWANADLGTTDNLPFAHSVFRWLAEPEPHCMSSFTVYLDTTMPPAAVVATGVPIPEHNPGLLTPCTTYFWQVAAVNPSGVTMGPIWSFTTEGCAPSPTGTVPTSTPLPNTPTPTSTPIVVVETPTPTPPGGIPTATPEPWFNEVEILCMEPLVGGGFDFMLIPKTFDPICDPRPCDMPLVVVPVACDSCAGIPCPDGVQCILNQIITGINNHSGGWSASLLEPTIFRIEGPVPFDKFIIGPELNLPPGEGFPLKPGCEINNLCNGVNGDEKHPFTGGYAFIVLHEPPDPCLLPDHAFDFNGNGVVDMADLLILIQALRTGEPFIDLTCDGVMDARDLLVFARRWLVTTTP